jgi:hypothetical protein
VADRSLPRYSEVKECRKKVAAVLAMQNRFAEAAHEFEKVNIRSFGYSVWHPTGFVVLTRWVTRPSKPGPLHGTLPATTFCVPVCAFSLMAYAVAPICSWRLGC